MLNDNATEPLRASHGNYTVDITTELNTNSETDTFEHFGGSLASNLTLRFIMHQQSDISMKPRPCNRLSSATSLSISRLGTSTVIETQDRTGQVTFLVVENSGPKGLEPSIDWVCVSPKAGTHVVQRSGNELKLVYPQPGADPDVFTGWDFDDFFLQPMDGPDVAANTAAALRRCLADGRWLLSLQTHKLVGIQ